MSSLLLKTASFVPNTADNTVFRAYGSAIHYGLANAGWQQVGSNTFPWGGTTWEDAVANGTLNSYGSYETWGMGDALQSTFPYYFRWENYTQYSTGILGTAFWSHSAPQGTGPGAIPVGGVLGVWGSSGVRAATAVANTDANKLTSYFCGDINRWVMALYTGTACTRPVTMSVERTHNANGADTTDGIMFAILGTHPTNTPAVLNIYWFHPKYGVVPADTTINVMLPSTGQSTGYEGPRIYPIYCSNGLFQNPLMNMVLVPVVYSQLGVPFSVTFYGNTHTYIPITQSGTEWTLRSGQTAANYNLAIRWE